MPHTRLVVFFFLSFTITLHSFGQPKRPGAPTAPAPAKVDVAVDDNDPLSSFPDKGLPEPAVLGLRPSAALAKSAAARILRYDEESLPVLIAALQKGGFHIIDANQKILFRPTTAPIGAAFYDFEVAGMLRATGLGAVTTVDKFGKLIANNDPDLTKANFPNLLLKDIRSARSSQDPQTQFIAALIFELGKGTADLASASPQQARINFIQASLIERVFLGDMLDAFERYSEQNASMIQQRRLFDRETGVMFVSASLRRASPTPCDDVADITKVAGMEGKIKKVGGKFFDKESIPSFFTAPKEAIKKRFENVAKGIEHANLISSYVKVVMANMNIRADVTVEDPIPLIRTKSNRNSGEERVVTAKFRIDFKHSDTINCVGKAVKTATGLDVEVPKDGPMKGVPVKWQPVLEGRGYSRYTGYPVMLDAVDRTRGDISKQVTDDLGENKIKVTGKPQARNLEQEPVVPQAKKAELTVSVATENMDASEDIPKIFWFGFEGDFGLKALIEVIPDILAKMPLKTYRVSVPVRDWQPCSDDWGGFVNYSLNHSQTIVVKANRSSNGNSTGDGIRRIVKDVLVNVVLNPRTPEEIVAKKDPKPADYRVRGLYSDIFEGSREGDPCCGPQEGNYTTKFRSGSETKFLTSFQKAFDLRFNGGDRDYSLAFAFSSDLITANIHKFTEILDTNCPLEYSEESSDYAETQVMVGETLLDGRYGERFVSPAGDLLQGTKKMQRPDGAEVTWEWALARCKR
jgi:hypothetical protein